jgi:hypothetical protein
MGSVVAAHHAAQPAGARLDEQFQPRLDRLASGVTRAMGQLAVALRAADQDGPQAPEGLPQLREIQQEIGTGPPGQDEESEVYGLRAATDSLVDAVNTAAHALDAGRTSRGG